MKNITLLKAKVGILAVSCLSITTLFACVDKDARSDLSPNLPTDQAQNGDFGDQAHLKSVISHIQGKTSSHNGKTYDSNIKFYHSATSSGEICVADHFIEFQGNLHAAQGVLIQDAALGAHHQLVLLTCSYISFGQAGFYNPSC